MSLAVIGATSEIARQTAKAFSEAGHDLFLVGRNTENLIEMNGEDFSTEVNVKTFQADISNIDSISELADNVIQSFGGMPYVLVAIGSVGKEEEAKLAGEIAVQLIDVNFRNIVALVTPIAEALKKKGKGCLIILSSVAGDRGRQSNYVYGSAKAGLSAYTQGLRNRLFRSGVHVLTVKPGYVDTRMLRLALGQRYDSIPSILIGTPNSVGQKIFQAAVHNKDVIYVPSIWRSIMFLVKAIPEKIFKRLKL